MGLHGGMSNGQGQWSVMGGTGELTMARGIINYKIIQEDGTSRTFEISICVFYTSKSTVPVSARSIFIYCHNRDLFLQVLSCHF